MRGVEYFGIVIEYFPKVIEFFTKVIEIRAYLMEIEQTLDIPKGGACRSALPLSQGMTTERASRTQELMEFGENKKESVVSDDFPFLSLTTQLAFAFP